jgi:hypothetical protein
MGWAKQLGLKAGSTVVLRDWGRICRLAVVISSIDGNRLDFA